MVASLLKAAAVALCLAVAAAPAVADPVGGPAVKVGVIEPGTTASFSVVLRGLEASRVVLAGDGRTCLELRVFDHRGNLVASDTLGLGDDRAVVVVPLVTGRFTIEVRSIGLTNNVFVLAVD